MKKLKMRDLFLVLLFGGVILTSWTGYFKVLGVQVHLLSAADGDLKLILGRTPAFPKPTAHRFLSNPMSYPIWTIGSFPMSFLKEV